MYGKGEEVMGVILNLVCLEEYCFVGGCVLIGFYPDDASSCRRALNIQRHDCPIFHPFAGVKKNWIENSNEIF